MTTTTDLLRVIAPTTLFAEYAGGGTLRVDRFNDDEALDKALGVRAPNDGTTRLIVALDQDIDDTPIDVVSFHPDQEVEIAYIDRAVVALQATREAFVAGQR